MGIGQEELISLPAADIDFNNRLINVQRLRNSRCGKESQLHERDVTIRILSAHRELVF